MSLLCSIALSGCEIDTRTYDEFQCKGTYTEDSLYPTVALAINQKGSMNIAFNDHFTESVKIVRVDNDLVFVQGEYTDYLFSCKEDDLYLIVSDEYEYSNRYEMKKVSASKFDDIKSYLSFVH